MSYVTSYKCTLCHEEFAPEAIEYTCPDCGEKGILDVLYDYEQIKKVMTKERLKDNSEPKYMALFAIVAIGKHLFGSNIKSRWNTFV